MSWEAIVALLTIMAVLYALARDLASADVVLMGAVTLLMSMSLVSARFPSPGDFAAAFGNEGLLTVAALFVVRGRRPSGGIRRAGPFHRKPGPGRAPPVPLPPSRARRG
jgi:hypothetical protein